jgi:hypothetical protein
MKGKILISFTRALLIAISLYLIYQHDFVFASAAIIATAVSFLPVLIEKNYKLTLPWIIQFLIVLALLLHIFGTILNWYSSFFFFSPLMHFIGTAVIALLAFIIIYSLNLTKYVKLSSFMIGFFTFMFAMGIGAMWEIGEFSLDKTIGTHNQGDGINPLDDTMYDLMWDGVAGLIIALFGSALVKSHHELIHPFEQYFRKLRLKYKKYRLKLKKKKETL